jgi:hypothetical protein
LNCAAKIAKCPQSGQWQILRWSHIVGQFSSFVKVYSEV